MLAHGFGPPWNPLLCRELRVGDKIQALLDAHDGARNYYPAEFNNVCNQFPTIQFDGAQLDIQDANELIIHDLHSPPNDVKSLVFLCRSLYKPVQISAHAHARQLTSATPRFFLMEFSSVTSAPSLPCRMRICYFGIA